MTRRFDLRAARLDRGLTQRALAEQAGLPYQMIQRLEAGLGIRPANAKKLADYLGIQVTDLMPLPAERSAAA